MSIQRGFILCPDTELIQRIRTGESEAFKILFNRYKVSIYNYARYLCFANFDADDLFQETWSRVINKITGNIEIINFKAWIFTIMINIHRDELRKIRIRRVFFPFQSSSGDIPEFKPGNYENSVEKNVSDLEFGSSFKAAILKLPLKERRVFILKAVEGFKHREISEMLDKPVGTIKYLLHSAVKILQKELVEYQQ